MNLLDEMKKKSDDEEKRRRAIRISKAAEEILAGWISATPGAGKVFIEEKAVQAMGAAKEMITALELMAR